MITANDVNAKRFEQARPGYKTEEVDEFLMEIANQLTQMIAEKEDADNKIGILVDSIREYKNDEDALKSALISAQKQAKVIISDANEEAEKIIADAKAKAELIIADANEEANDIIGTAGERAEKAKNDLASLRKETSDFKSEVLAMYKKHLELITAIPADSTDNTESKKPAKKSTPAAPVVRKKPAVEETAEVDILFGDDDTAEDLDNTVIFDTPESAAEHLNKITK